MEQFTQRLAHLEYKPHYKPGDLIYQNNLVCRMGNTGQSKWPHLHTDCIYGYVDKIIRLKYIGDDKEYKPCKKQLGYFIDKGLFKVEPYITTPYLDPEYEKVFGKKHPAIDLVPIDRHKTNKHFDIYWNRTKTGHVLAVGFDKGGYGNYILIGFEA